LVGTAARALAAWSLAAPAAPADPSPSPAPARESRPGRPRAQPDEPMKFPRLVLAVHGALGPHSTGEESCIQQGSRVLCDRTGRFLGAGGAVELRVRLVKFFYAHARFLAVGNAFGRGDAALHDGLLAPAAGLSLMSDLALLRLEFLAPFTLGDSRYRAAGTTKIATERWGRAAGGLSIGARLRFYDRVRGELTAGFQIGPDTDRDTPTDQDRSGPLITFSVGLGTAFDLVPDRKR
jgi:hypothetical protein